MNSRRMRRNRARRPIRRREPDHPPRGMGLRRRGVAIAGIAHRGLPRPRLRPPNPCLEHHRGGGAWASSSASPSRSSLRARCVASACSRALFSCACPGCSRTHCCSDSWPPRSPASGSLLQEPADGNPCRAIADEADNRRLPLFRCRRARAPAEGEDRHRARRRARRGRSPRRRRQGGGPRRRRPRRIR